MTILEMIKEWRKGCSCGLRNPADCPDCTMALVDAIEAKLIKQNTPLNPKGESGPDGGDGVIHNGRIGGVGGDALYTPEMAGSGQFGKCGKCGKLPTQEGHDGCVGTLEDKDVMNACCGHGSDNQAYVQFYSKPRISGQEATDYIRRSKQ